MFKNVIITNTFIFLFNKEKNYQMEFKIKERTAFDVKIENDENKRKDIIKFLKARIKEDPLENSESKTAYLKLYKYEKVKDNSYQLFSANSKNGKLLGVCVSEIYNEHLLRIDWLAVDTQHRRQGIGFAILNYVIDYAKRHNLYNLECISLVLNKESKKFLKKAGFRKVGKLKHYWAKQDYYLWEYLP